MMVRAITHGPRTVPSVALTFDDGPGALTGDILDVLAGHVLWDVDPRDFQEPGSAAIRDRTLAAVRPGSVVLLHDDRPQLAATVDALDSILLELAGRGLRAATVSELLRMGDT